MQGVDLRNVDRLASDTLEPVVVADRPVSLILKERGEDRKSEVRSLAARCLAYLDSFETLVKEFGDERQRSYWTSEFDVLRQSLSRSPETAASVRKALESYCGADAARSLPPELGLQSRNSFNRVAIESWSNSWTMIRWQFVCSRSRTCNGLPTRRCSSCRGPMTEKSSIQSWKKQLQSGAIVYESLPSPLQSDQ